MLTVQELYNSAKKSGLSKLRLEQYRVRLFNTEVDERSIHFIMPVNSYTTPGVTYNVDLFFTPVTFVDEDDFKRISNVGRVKVDNLWYYFVKPANYTPIQVSCTCKNYVYTWAYYNAQKGSHFGPLPKIEPPKGLRPPRNPEHIPGMCKHIAAALNATWGFTRVSLPKF